MDSPRSMVGENFAGNIIVNLASLPDFLRNPILKKRMMEFFSLAEPDRKEVINNALEAGPTIPFPNFSRLFNFSKVLIWFFSFLFSRFFDCLIGELLLTLKLNN